MIAVLMPSWQASQQFLSSAAKAERAMTCSFLHAKSMSWKYPPGKADPGLSHTRSINHPLRARQSVNDSFAWYAESATMTILVSIFLVVGSLLYRIPHQDMFHFGLLGHSLHV